MNSETGLFGDIPQAVKKVGHIDTPGTGPEGETCGSCQHCIRIRYHNKNYHKCGLMEPLWTHGAGTDIKKKDAACKSWEEIDIVAEGADAQYAD